MFRVKAQHPTVDGRLFHTAGEACRQAWLLKADLTFFQFLIMINHD